MDEQIYIVRCGEVALKGRNKPMFEKMLADRIRKILRKLGGIRVVRKGGLIFVYADKEVNGETIIKEISKIFGIASISPAVTVPYPEKGNKEGLMAAIEKEAGAYMERLMGERKIETFKVDAKRADKSFPIKSPEIAKKVGAAVLKHCRVLKVDVHNPDVYLFVDVRPDVTYLYQQKIPGFGGLPLGCNGKGLVLLSGGIDSPVATWMMAKRGMNIEALHFHSYPYTSERAMDKVKELAERLAVYCSRFTMYTVNLLPIQERIIKDCPEGEMTVLTRRFMMKIGEKIAEKTGCLMLITGESLGQVASQTAEALVVTDQAVSMPVMRPLIAMDKVDIMEKAEEIDTYEISIRPYEDCCTVFLPKNPVTKPKLKHILASESRLDVEKLVEEAVASMESREIYPQV